MTDDQIRRELTAFQARWILEATQDQTNDKARWIAQGVRLTVNFIVSMLLQRGNQ
jgi:hypothetical protein